MMENIKSLFIISVLWQQVNIKMFKIIKIKSPIATKEISISKQKGQYYYTVDIISYGNWDCTQFKTIKECFNYIRHIFGKEK